MGFIGYGLVTLGVLVLLLSAGVAFARLLQAEEPRHVDPDLLVEMPPPSTRGGGRVHTPPAPPAFD
jgi:hypothetical protein